MEILKNELDIKVFRLKQEINLPIKSEPDEIAECSVGNLLVCWDGKNVYAKDCVGGANDIYSLLLNDLAFFEVNEAFFENIG